MGSLVIGVVVGSTRPQRRSPGVAQWVTAAATARGLQTTVLDLAAFDLPMLDEPTPPAMGAAVHDHTKQWGAAVGRCDAFVFVVPEYNRSVPAVLKNAIDYLWAEWNDKAAGFVGYGVHGGVRAVEHLRQITSEVGLAGVRHAVALSLFEDFDDGGLRPRPHLAHQLEQVLDDVVRWGDSLRRAAV